ncbi:MAG: hypothetical protein Q4G49_05605 [Paracoccus sp. (in: a-proteobacteria)]|nr:hypothetical protein [Paracoccus sp. (in: a-proteobacteria)]
MAPLHREGMTISGLLLAATLAFAPLPLMAQGKDNGRDPVHVGDVLKLDGIHIINQPGRYGLGVPPAGDDYAVVNGRLIRVDSKSGKVLSILRQVDAILD